MNPFLEVPLVVETTRVAVKNNFWKSPHLVTEQKQETLRLRPGEIETYQSDGADKVHLTMKSGKQHTVAWPFDMMDQALISYNNTINSKDNKGKFGNVVVTQKQDKIDLKPAKS